MNYYSILGVSKTASPEEIKKAYKKLAMQHHPDRGGDSKKFQDINEAYDTLKNPEKRKEYDNPQPQFRSQNFSQANWQDQAFNDLFGSMFHRTQRSGQAPKMKNPDITVGLEVNIEDVILGNHYVINYQMSNGKLETVTVDIPVGVRDGIKIRFKGLGDIANPRIPRGDLYVKIRIKQSNKWQIDNSNLLTHQKVNVFDLILGTEIIIETPENKKVKIKIPAGTQSGSTFSITGYGVPDMNTKRRGNLYVKVESLIPKIEEPDLLEKIKELKNETSLFSK